MKHAAVEVVLTGTGTPIPVAGRAGPGVLVRTEGAVLQFDVGRSTTLRLAEAGVRTDELDAVFITHHHSDHVTDLGDILVSAWLLNSERSVDVVAPEGLTTEFVRSALEPLEGDMAFRRGHRGVAGIAEPRIISFAPVATPELVWQKNGVRVEAVRVRHEPVEAAVGYRVETEAGRVVISGDTKVCEEMELLADGARILVHEVVAAERVPASRRHTIDYHSLPEELGAMAERARVEALALTHLWPSPETETHVRDFAEGVRRGGYTGDVVVGSDLTSLQIDRGNVQVHIPEGSGIRGLHLPKTTSALAT